jgi:hypothetical protein
MGALLQSFVIDLETDMQEIVAASAYDGLNEDPWWHLLVKTRTSGSLKDIFFWFVDTFQIRSEGREGGNKHFEELASMQTEITHEHFGGGIILKNDQLQDQDGRGLDQAAAWSRQAGAQMAYHPQKLATHFLKNGHLSATAGGYSCYDGVPFFSKLHLINPTKASVGTFANLFSGAPVAASGYTRAYPGALPIDESVTVDVALANLLKMFAYIRSIPQPIGSQPRRLKIDKIFVGPTLFPRVVQLTNAKFIAQASAAAGTAVGDVELLVKSLGYATPVLCEELEDLDGGTSYFVSIKTTKSDPYGAVIYTEREPFSINWYGMMTERELKSRQELEYHIDGRNSISPGRPELLFKGMKT